MVMTQAMKKATTSDAVFPENAANPGGVRVLLAEDDEDVRIALTRFLEFGGCRVCAVGNGSELLEHLTTWLLSGTEEPPADVILTDMRMPGVNGLSIVEGLRENGWTQPIVIISAFGDDGIKERIEKLGGVKFIPKPFNPSDLETLLADITHKY